MEEVVSGKVFSFGTSGYGQSGSMGRTSFVPRVYRLLPAFSRETLPGSGDPLAAKTTLQRVSCNGAHDDRKNELLTPHGHLAKLPNVANR